MPEQTHIPKPEFDVDDNISAELLEQDIYKRPDAYRTVLSLGTLAVFEAESQAPVESDVIKGLRDFFDSRLDRFVEFDQATEDALEADKKHQALISSISSARNTEEKDKNRDNARHYRFAFFIDRVINYQSQQKSRLRRTG